MNDRQSDYQRLIAPVERRMLRVLWRIVRDQADAEDAMQNALIVIWKQWGKVAAHPNPQALVLTIAINAGYDVLRRRRRFAWWQKNELSNDIPDETASAFETLSGSEQCRAVMNAIARLSRNQGRAILMHAVEEMSYGDIAAAMNCSEVTVRKHVARARARLREMLPRALSYAAVDEGTHG
jgi:RNA polymerase sigma-70 factor (ECF subfamily)